MEMTHRGQATVTDTLYFLLIVTGLCAFLFIFANQYGLSVADQISRQYYSTYATSALKTILYSSAPRDPAQTLYDPDAEIDHLLAIVKEDYADDETLTITTKKVLAGNIMKIMGPIAPSFDYVFYIFKPDETPPGTVFVMMHVSQIQYSPSPAARGFVITTPGATPHKDYFCENATYERLQKMLLSVGSTSLSSSKMELLVQPADPDEEAKKIMAEVDLAMWPATVPAPGVFNEASWSCSEI